MNVLPWFDRETWRLDRYEWMLVAAGSLGVGLVTVIAWSTPFATFLFLVLPAVLLFITGQPLGQLELTRLGVWAGITILYVTLSIFWSADFMWTLDALWPLYGSIAAVGLGLSAFRAPPVNWLAHLCRAALISYCICLSFALIEQTTDHAIKRILFWPFQAIHLVDGDIAINWEHVSKVRPHRSNWSVTLLIFLAWPLLIFLETQLKPAEFRIGRLLLMLALAATVLQSDHQSAMVAYVAGWIIFAIARLNFRIAVLLTAFAWVAAFIIFIPITKLAYQNDLHLSEQQLPASFRHRIVLWKFTVDKIAEKPVFGVGAGATHPLNEARKDVAEKVPGTDFLMETGTHAHNIYLQVLYELGIVGTVLLAILGLLVIAAIFSLGQNMNGSYFLALFATWAAQSGFSFGLFEAWYVFAITFAVCLAIAAQSHWILVRSTAYQRKF
ncbi:MAG: O-antigen ligase family protein [Pseudomonadota bacterium]